jgi:hypothetical protein
MPWTIKNIANQLKLNPNSIISTPITYNGKSYHVIVHIKEDKKTGMKSLYVSIFPSDKEVQHEIITELLKLNVLEEHSRVNDKNASGK